MSQIKYSRGRTLYLVRLAVLAVILLILEITGIGYIKTPGIELTILQVPVIVGAIILGPGAGAILGGVFGMTSFWQAVSGKSAFGLMLFNMNPFGAIMTTIPTRILMGFLCGLFFRFLKGRMKSQNLRYILSSLSGALLNTVFFMSMLMLFYYQSNLFQGIAESLGTKSALLFVFAFVGVQGAVEAVVCAVLGSAIIRAVLKSVKP